MRAGGLCGGTRSSASPSRGCGWDRGRCRRFSTSDNPWKGIRTSWSILLALPRGLYFTLLARLLYHVDNWGDGRPPNVHVLVAEDPDLDARIQDVGVDESAEFLPGFSAAFSREATTYPTVWLPLLGEKRQPQVERLYDLIKPDEVVPVLPSPSRMPRRGDALLMEYRDFLFDQLRIDPRNILYVSEQNPFEVYRQVRRSVLYFREVLGLLGGCRFALSALSSKLMSLGGTPRRLRTQDRRIRHRCCPHRLPRL